jgi:hypothetical protein
MRSEKKKTLTKKMRLLVNEAMRTWAPPKERRRRQSRVRIPKEA